MVDVPGILVIVGFPAQAHVVKRGVGQARPGPRVFEVAVDDLLLACGRCGRIPHGLHLAPGFTACRVVDLAGPGFHASVRVVRELVGLGEHDIVDQVAFRAVGTAGTVRIGHAFEREPCDILSPGDEDRALVRVPLVVLAGSRGRDRGGFLAGLVARIGDGAAHRDRLLPAGRADEHLHAVPGVLVAAGVLQTDRVHGVGCVRRVDVLVEVFALRGGRDLAPHVARAAFDGRPKALDFHDPSVPADGIIGFPAEFHGIPAVHLRPWSLARAFHGHAVAVDEREVLPAAGTFVDDPVAERLEIAVDQLLRIRCARGRMDGHDRQADPVRLRGARHEQASAEKRGRGCDQCGGTFQYAVHCVFSSPESHVRHGFGKKVLSGTFDGFSFPTHVPRHGLSWIRRDRCQPD